MVNGEIKEIELSDAEAKRFDAGERVIVGVIKIAGPDEQYQEQDRARMLTRMELEVLRSRAGELERLLREATPYVEQASRKFADLGLPASHTELKNLLSQIKDAIEP